MNEHVIKEQLLYLQQQLRLQQTQIEDLQALQTKSSRGLDEYFTRVISIIIEAIPAQLYVTDGRKELGILAIVAWYHGIVNIAAKYKVAFECIQDLPTEAISIYESV